MRLNFDDPPARGILSVEFVEAEYDANYVDAARRQTYCIVWVLEKIKWRRRKSQPAAGLRPAWGAAFDFDEVRDDMVASDRPMDRLVCGDVGFGKTEGALRAVYRAVCSGKQARARNFRRAIRRNSAQFSDAGRQPLSGG